MTQDKLVNSSGGVNNVELVGYYGSDETHALSAWTSTSRDLTDEKRGRIPALLERLASNEHGTPFEKSSLHFLVTVEAATHIQLLKHRAGVSFNGESARYKELRDDKFYIPVDWTPAERQEYVEFMEEALRKYHTVYSRLIAAGVPKPRAKESARFYLPYGNQITADIMFNFRSFMHFVGLRYSSHAQMEIRDLAYSMVCYVRDTHAFDESLRAFGLIDGMGNVLPVSE